MDTELSAREYNLFLEGYKQGKKDFSRPEGLWKYRPYTYYCSNCNNPALELEEYPYLSNYCPFCGAEMEIEE